MGGDDPFRSDHDAALARVDALEVENRELRDELERAKQPPPEPDEPERPEVEPRVRASIIFAGIAVAIVAIAAVASVGHKQRDVQTTIDESVQRADREFQRRFLDDLHVLTADHSLGGCIASAQEREGLDWTDRARVGLNASSPWEQYCEPVVAAAIANTALSEASRDLLQAWSDAEHRLANVRRIVGRLPGSTSDPMPPGIREAVELVRAERVHAIADVQPALDELAAITPDPLDQLLH